MSPHKKKTQTPDHVWRCACLETERNREVCGSAVALLRGENANLKAQLMASVEKEAALSRVLKDQAAELLGGVTAYPQ